MAILRRQAKTKRQLLAEERAIVRATELVAEAMHVQGVTKSELADRLGVSRSEITQRLQGGRNLTLRSVADMLDALDRQLLMGTRPLLSSADSKRTALCPMGTNAVIAGAVQRPAANVEYLGDDVHDGGAPAAQRSA